MFDKLIVTTDPIALGWTPIDDGDGGCISLFSDDHWAREWQDWEPQSVVTLFSEKARIVAGGGCYTPYKAGKVTAGFTMDRDGDGLGTPPTSIFGRLARIDRIDLSAAIREFNVQGLFRMDRLFAGGVPVKMTDENASKVAAPLLRRQETDPYGPVLALALLIRSTATYWTDMTEQQRRTWYEMARGLTKLRLQTHALMVQHPKAFGGVNEDPESCLLRGELAKLLGVSKVGGTMQYWMPDSAQMYYGETGVY